MKTTLAVGLTVLLGTTVFGTNQILDEMTYEGTNYFVRNSGCPTHIDFDSRTGKACTNYLFMSYNFLMERYFEQHPEKHPQTIQRARSIFIVSTALARGYIAVFEIKDNQLYLSQIKVQDGFNKWTDILPEIFPGQESLKIDWLTGVLLITSKSHDLYYSDIEKETLTGVALEFDNGKLIKAAQVSGRSALGQFFQRQYDALEKTEEYQTRRAELLKNETARHWYESVERLEKASRMAQIFKREYQDAYCKAFDAFVALLNAPGSTYSYDSYQKIEREILGEYAWYDLCDKTTLKIHFYFKVKYPDEYEKIKPGLEKKYEEYGETLSPYSEDIIRSRLYSELPKLFVD